MIAGAPSWRSPVRREHVALDNRRQMPEALRKTWAMALPVGAMKALFGYPKIAPDATVFLNSDTARRTNGETHVVERWVNPAALRLVIPTPEI